MSEAVIAEPLVTEAESRVAVATQRQLIWWRFRKHRLAVISAGIVLAFYLVAAFADVIAYSEPFDTEAARSYIPPQPIHWFDADGHFHPHVYALKGKRDLRTFKLSYAPDPSDPRTLAWFGHGYPYALFGLFPTDRHLLALTDGRPQDAIFLLGTDQLGRDVFSRLVLATRTSLTIGLAGVTLSLLLGVFLAGQQRYRALLAVLYSIYLGGYRKAVEESLLPAQPKRFIETMRKIQSKHAASLSRSSK